MDVLIKYVWMSLFHHAVKAKVNYPKTFKINLRNRGVFWGRILIRQGLDVEKSPPLVIISLSAVTIGISWRAETPRTL